VEDLPRIIAAQIAPRVLVTVQVEVTDILDLRVRSTRAQLELTMEVLRCATDDRNGYARCQRVAQAAHQRGLHGLIAPAATRLGETLVLFTDLLPKSEMPTRCAEDQIWRGLPVDPRNATVRRLRVVRDRPE
jgi:hypothetical protein